MKLAKSAALLLVLAACAAPAETIDTTDTTAVAPPSSTTTQAAQPVAFAYRYQPDSQLAYRVQVEQEIAIAAEGDTDAIGAGELPLDGQVSTAVETIMSYQAFAGPIDGTTELVITASFEDVSVSGTMNGEPFSPSEDDLGFSSIPPIDATFIVDETGKIISSSLDSLGAMFGGGVESLQGLGQDSLSRPLGPRFPEGDLEVGDTWTNEETIDGPSGPITSRSTHSVIGVEEVDGIDTYVIETVTQADPFEIDLTEIFRAMFQGMMSFEGGDDQEELESVLEQLEFRIAVAPSEATATTWFDALAGQVQRAVMETSVTLTMTFRGPDETTGELVGFTMDMSLAQTARFDLESARQTTG